MITSSVETAHPPLLIVHLKVADAPTVNPVTPELADAGVVIVAAPETKLQLPVPTAGVLPAKVAEVTLHKPWSGPALDVVAGEATLIITSSNDDAQAPLLMVHLNVALEPIVKPVKPDVGDDGVVIVAVPATTLQLPVPTAGVLPARVAVVTLHRF